MLEPKVLYIVQNKVELYLNMCRLPGCGLLYRVALYDVEHLTQAPITMSFDTGTYRRAGVVALWSFRIV